MIRPWDEIAWYTVQLDGIDRRDYPDFVDAYAVYAEWRGLGEEGRPLTDAELDAFNAECAGDIQARALEIVCGG